MKSVGIAQHFCFITGVGRFFLPDNIVFVVDGNVDGNGKKFFVSAAFDKFLQHITVLEKIFSGLPPGLERTVIFAESILGFGTVFHLIESDNGIGSSFTQRTDKDPDPVPELCKSFVDVGIIPDKGIVAPQGNNDEIGGFPGIVLFERCKQSKR